MSKEARAFFHSTAFSSMSCTDLSRQYISFFNSKRKSAFFSFLFLFFFSCFYIQIPLFAATYRTSNFLVHSQDAAFARSVGDAAERFRSELSFLWLGHDLPRWTNPCDVEVVAGSGIPAGGETVFTFGSGEVYDWKMRVQGSKERILDSVLPHEITHAIVASYLRAPAPRWLDEGMATSVESDVERNHYRSMLVSFLRNKRGIAFNDMISMKEYPEDLTPFYSQAFSICEYLILIGGRRRLIEFAKNGYETNDWDLALKNFYECESLGYLQMEWIEWIRLWADAGQPQELPLTRKLPEFNAFENSEIMMAHNERLSPQDVNPNNLFVETNSQRNGIEPRFIGDVNQRIYDKGRNEQTDGNYLTRGQNVPLSQRNRQSTDSNPLPRTSFDGLPMYRKTISSRGRNNGKLDIESGRNRGIGESVQGRGEIPVNSFEPRVRRSTENGRSYDNPTFDRVNVPINKRQVSNENFLINGAGSANRWNQIDKD